MKVARILVTILLIGIILIGYVERRSVGQTSSITTYASTYLLTRDIASTETIYSTIYSTAYYRQFESGGPQVKVTGSASVALGGYSASLWTTVLNLFDQHIFNVAVTFRVVAVWNDGRKSKLNAGAKLVFKEGIRPGESKSVNDVLLIQYQVGEYGAWAPPYLATKDYHFEMEFWAVDFSTYPFRTAVDTTTMHSMATETHVTVLTSIIVMETQTVEESSAQLLSVIILVAVTIGAIIILIIFRRQKRRIPQDHTCTKCGAIMGVADDFCTNCGKKRA